MDGSVKSQGSENIMEDTKDKESPYTYSYWLDEIKLSKKEQEKWIERADKIVKRYKDERNNHNDSNKKLNLFWSGIQTLQPALYARVPKVQIERRFKDQDIQGRDAATILERGTSFIISNQDFDSVMRQVRDDYLLCGRGVAWVRYAPVIETVNGVEQFVSEDVKIDYLFWKDFIHSPARFWQEVRWVGRISYLTRDKLIKRFGEEVGNKVSLDFTPESIKEICSDVSKANDVFKRAKVYEIWDKTTKKVFWLCEGYKNEFLDVKDDPLGLKNFFPCAKPLFATLTNDSLIPIPDYSEAQDIAKEIDELTFRIDLITKAIKVRGGYDETMQGLGDILGGSDETKLLPIKNWTQFAQAGGFKGAIDFLPIDSMVSVLRVLIEAREMAKQNYFEVTGLSDIVRGQGNPNETATAQQIKGQFATLRLEDRQKEVQRFARDLIQIVAEIIAEHYKPQTLALISGVNLLNPQTQQKFLQTVQLLKNDLIRNFRIDIETDSTIAVDEAQDKQARIEFLTSFGQFLQNVLQLGQALPAMMPMLQELLMFSVRSFKAGRNLESSIEQGFLQLQQMQQAQANQPPAPSPEEIKMQAEQAKVQQDAQIRVQEMQIDWQKFQQQMQMDLAKMQKEAEKNQATLTLEAEKVRQELALKAQELQMTSELKAAELISKKKESGEEDSGMEEEKKTIHKVAFDTDETGKRIVYVTEELI